VFRFAFGDYDIDGVLYKLDNERNIDDLILFSLKMNETTIGNCDTAYKFIAENVVRAIDPINSSLKKLKIIAITPSGFNNLNGIRFAWNEALTRCSLGLDHVSVDVWSFDDLLNCVNPDFKLIR
jgi:hypothetical protein